MSSSVCKLALVAVCSSYTLGQVQRCREHDRGSGLSAWGVAPTFCSEPDGRFWPMASMAADEVQERLGEIVNPLTDAESDYEPLLQSLGDATFVLLGEATHGTHEFYKARTELTKHLIEEKGFN